MRTQRFALIFGIAFLLAGILGFVPGVLTAPHHLAPELRVDAWYGNLLGLFPVNALHNVVHLVIGLWGLWASKGFDQSRRYGRGLAVIYGLFAVMGLFPGLSTVFGLVPLFSHDIWLHAGSAAIAAYFGFAPITAVEGKRPIDRSRPLPV